MKIAVFGLGYVGLSTALMLCEKNHVVHGFDIDDSVVLNIKNGSHLREEPRVKELVSKHLGSSFVLDHAVDSNPVKYDFAIMAGYLAESTMASIEQLLSDLDAMHRSADIVVIRSTLPTTNKLPDHVVVVPEFLRQGKIISDSMNPTRLVIGGSDPQVIDAVEKLFGVVDCPVFKVSHASAVLAKLAANTLLAAKATLANNIATEINNKLLDASIEDISDIISADPRLGTGYFSPSLGIGGGCIPKDVGFMRGFLGNTSTMVSGLAESLSNNSSLPVMVSMKKSTTGEPIIHPTHSRAQLVLLGCGFKPSSSDLRKSPVIDLVIYLSRENLRVVDPRHPMAGSRITLSEDVTLKIYNELPSDYNPHVDNALIVNTDDQALISDTLSAGGFTIVYDPANIIDATAFFITYGGTIRLVQNGIFSKFHKKDC